MKKYAVMVLAVTGVACGHAGTQDGGAQAVEAVAPATLTAAVDASDRGCQVVLRTLSRVPNQTGGYQTHCTNQCWYVWAGTLEVAKTATGVVPHVLYHNVAQPTWEDAVATPVDGAAAGFQRYSFRLDNNTVPDSMNLTALMRTRIEVAPYLKGDTGGRLFDHNRNAGDFENYALTQSNAWNIGDDAAVCAPAVSNRGKLGFGAAWTTTTTGTLVAGGTGVIEYALERLPDCRATHNGFPAWDTVAGVRFLPGGQTVEGSVRFFDAPGGVPSNVVHPLPFEFQIPRGTTTAQVWFHNSSGAGNVCDRWDSNFGNNYSFAVAANAPPPVQWVGNAGSSFNRACTRENGAPQTVVLDSYSQQRACSFVEVDVWGGGLTDVPVINGGRVWAEAVATLDGVALPVTPLWFVGRVGNDYRYHYDLPRSLLSNGPKWNRLEYTLRFSANGVTWTQDLTRVANRDPTWCSGSWASCSVP